MKADLIFPAAERIASRARSKGFAAIPAAAAAGPCMGAEGWGRVGAVYLWTSNAEPSLRRE